MRMVLIKAKPYRSRRTRTSVSRQAGKRAMYVLAFATGLLLSSVLVRHAASPPVPRAAFHSSTVPAPGHAAPDTMRAGSPGLAGSRAPKSGETRPGSGLSSRNIPSPVPSPAGSSPAKAAGSPQRPVSASVSRPAQPGVARLHDSGSSSSLIPSMSRPAAPGVTPAAPDSGSVPAATPQQAVPPAPAGPPPPGPAIEPGSTSGAAPQDLVPPPQPQGPGPALRTQGVLTAVNADASTFSITTGRKGTVLDFRVTSGTAIFVGTERLPLKRLHDFRGRPVTVWSAQIDTSQVAGRVMLLATAAGTMPANAALGSQDGLFWNAGSGAGSTGGGGTGGGTSAAGGGGGSGSGGGALGGLGGAVEKIESTVKP
jgi:hypothetical protein